MQCPEYSADCLRHLTWLTLDNSDLKTNCIRLPVNAVALNVMCIFLPYRKEYNKLNGYKS